MIEILSCEMIKIDFAYTRALFQLLGISPNRHIFILDQIVVPINIGSPCKEI